jgi:short-subunit dehydrogenase
LALPNQQSKGKTMNKVCVIFGAGSGLGISVARRFGREGYRIALVARNRVALEENAAALGAEGLEAKVFAADLTDEAAIVSLVATLHAQFGRIDVVYYAPTTNDAFLPAAALTPKAMMPFMALWFFGMVKAVSEILPQMRIRGSGAILTAFGSNAVQGEPYMSGSGPAQAAARNYLFSLHGELAAEDIHVGMVSINGVIKGSGYHQAMEQGQIDVPEGVVMPEVDPDEMAEMLWRAASGTGAIETFYPG